jgi:hypothetical protein
MAPRALAALLAVLAAIAFVVSIASSAWWAGNPSVAGKTIHAKHVRVGLMGATGCNTGGDGTCEDVKTGATLQLVGSIELGAIGLATFLAFALAISAWTVGDRRKGLAKTTITITLLVAAGGGLVLALGPDIDASAHVDVPIGWGTFVFAGAVAASVIASLVTRTLEPEPLRLKPGVAPLPPAPPDLRDLVRDQNELAPRDSVPHIPQLRPLYDPQNAGYMPALQSPSMPLAPPEPYGREQVKALTGQVTPTPERVNPFGSPNPGVAPPMPQPGEPGGPPVDPFARTAPRPQGGEAPPMAPPIRAKAPSAAPPPPNRNRPPSIAPLPNRNKPASAAPPPFDRTKSPSAAPPPFDRTKSPSAAPPPNRNKPVVPTPGAPHPKPTSVPPSSPGTPARARTELGPGTDPVARSLKTPERPSEPELRPSAPTMAHAVPPMPTAENQAPPARLSGRDLHTSVEIDAGAKAAARAAEAVLANKSTARGTLDPRIAAKVTRNATDVQTDEAALTTDQHERVDPTETGLEIERAPRSQTSTDGQTLVGAVPESPSGESDTAVGEPPQPPRKAATIITGEERVLSTMQRSVARAPTEDAFETGRAAIVPPDGPLTDELAAQPSTEMDAIEAPVTEVHSVVTPDDLAAELAQSAIGEHTDMTRMSTIGERRDSESTPIPTFHRAPSAQIQSTAPSTLPPPRTAEPSSSGPSPACPQCESPMAWVEEHLRFYCKQCRMYF